jgi:glycolate oxidase FAD binding subunit
MSMDALNLFRGQILEWQPLCIRGSGSKDFYGGPLVGQVLDTRPYSGIVHYEPTELVITARCGTPLSEVESALARYQQHLAFEPPHFGHATLGGMVASGLSGPTRAALGSLRDHVLGVRIMDGEGRVLRFGGEVMKNVAGFDVSRLMVGALGTLGLILEVSLKVMPMPLAEASLRFEISQDEALTTMNRWAGEPWPLVASAWENGLMTVRLAGAHAAVAAACQTLGGDRLEPLSARQFWQGLREQTSAFFAGNQPIWRLSLPSIAPPIALSGPILIEWGGSQRWLQSDAHPDLIREVATQNGGHATLFRGSKARDDIFTPPSAPLMEIHRRLKQRFDPHQVFNRGRLYPEF